jgi:hypothetical protein
MSEDNWKLFSPNSGPCYPSHRPHPPGCMMTKRWNDHRNCNLETVSAKKNSFLTHRGLTHLSYPRWAPAPAPPSGLYPRVVPAPIWTLPTSCTRTAPNSLIFPNRDSVPHVPRSPLRSFVLFFSEKNCHHARAHTPAARTTYSADARAHRTSSWSSLWCQQKSLRNVLLSRDHVCCAALCAPQAALRCPPPGSPLAHCAVLCASEDMACDTLCTSRHWRGGSRRRLLR